MKSLEAETAGSDVRQMIDLLADRFEAAWSQEGEPDLANFLQEANGTARRSLAIELVHLDLEWSQRREKVRTLEYYASRLPELLEPGGALPQEIVEHFWSLQNEPHRQLVDREAAEDASQPPEAHLSDPYRTASPAPEPAGSAPSATGSLPATIGRYRVERILGKGGFGCVYLAHDEQLGRRVAVKVPHSHLVARPEDAQLYLAEARTVAGLDHPHIVPVYDIGSTPDFPVFVVSKYVEGTDLATRLAHSRLSYKQAAEVIAKIAEALHYAHKQGLVHRDVKPGNILVATGGEPFVVDFGLALREQDAGKGQRYAGTPAYFSPEQARGEGHRVDGRSDIFSLGVVLYEALVGKRPFRADSQRDLLDQISLHEPRPPRQHDESIPKELERICFKALAKRATERYSTAHDLAEDLRHFLAVTPQTLSNGTPLFVPQPTVQAGNLTPPLVTPTTPPSDSRPLKIIPKGLRSFDAHDADFFLELLPGPRDREGLPDSLRFWKTKIEETDPESTFQVGLIYGPSGCGKSSLVKAGLLPWLSADVVPIYVESTADETEARLLAGLQRRCPALPAGGLKEALAALRQGQGIPPGKKVLIILDQFEQWLHAKHEESGAELVQALRQCDGGRVQALVMVRDDFWMAATRFMRELEIRLLEGQNSAAVDLFDLDHARKVLAAFGRAFGRLADAADGASREQKEFLKQAVRGLAQDGKIVCVRLALFAEMMKGKPWTPAALKQVGGAEGVGVTFLEETFSAATAPPEHRLHQKGAREVLKALLPESGADIKGHMKSSADLLAASGYAQRPKDFEDLIRILNSEVRLITPTDPEGQAGLDEPASQPQPGQKYYQLTHDYLVPSLRDWLTRKRKETKKGRAELRLEERTASWSRKPEIRHLPAWWEWVNIRLFTRRKHWTPSQRQMMKRADRHHGLWSLATLAALALIVLAGWVARRQNVEQTKATVAAGLVRRLLDAETERVPGIIEAMDDYRPWTGQLLIDANVEAQASEKEAASEAERIKWARRHLHASLALLPEDPAQAEYLYRRLLNSEPQEVIVIRRTLLPYQAELIDRLWGVVEQSQRGEKDERLAAASALALYDPSSSRWNKATGTIVSQLVAGSPSSLSAWMDALEPVKKRLLPPLKVVFHDRSGELTSERNLATSILAEYASDQPDLLANLVMDADEKQFPVLFPKLEAHTGAAATLFEKELAKPLVATAPAAERDALAKRQANAGVGLLLLQQPQKVWPLLKHSPDPSVRSYLIHRIAPLRANRGIIIEQLRTERDVSIRRALLLILGEFGIDQLPLTDREKLIPTLLQTYRDDPDPGIHGASEWLLRQWHQEQRLTEIDKSLATGQIEGDRNWYINHQGQMLAVVPGQVEFLMGSPPVEEGREHEGPDETQHLRQIDWTFAIAGKEVTVEQFLKFREEHPYNTQYAPTADCPINHVSWYEAVAYCNWLSKKDDIPPPQWCYVPNEDGKYAEGMKLAPGCVRLMGYRLPTEAEWEFACRAGATTSRYYGQTEELLGEYAWFVKRPTERRTIPSGSRKPNDLGLFDMLGNAWERCHGRFADYRVAANDERGAVIHDDETHAMRGGSIFDASSIRCADREMDGPTGGHNYIGFRPVRTLPKTRGSSKP